MFIQRAKKKKVVGVILILSTFFYLIPTLINESKGGYLNSFFMFSNMYMIGAYIRLYSDAKLIKYIKLGGILGGTIIYSSILIFDYMALYNPFYRSYDNVMAFPSSGANLFVLMAALGIFIWFNERKVPLNHKINTIAATTFAVYLIHDNAFLVDFLWNGIIKGYEFYKSDFLVVHMLLSSMMIFIVCALLEYIRIRLIERPMMHFLKLRFNR